MHVHSHHHPTPTSLGYWASSFTVSLKKTNQKHIYEPYREKTCLRGFSTRSDINKTVQPKKMVGDLKFRIDGSTIYIVKTKALISSHYRATDLPRKKQVLSWRGLYSKQIYTGYQLFYVFHSLLNVHCIAWWLYFHISCLNSCCFCNKTSS